MRNAWICTSTPHVSAAHCSTKHRGRLSVSSGRARCNLLGFIARISQLVNLLIPHLLCPHIDLATGCDPLPGGRLTLPIGCHGRLQALRFGLGSSASERDGPLAGTFGRSNGHPGSRKNSSATVRFLREIFSAEFGTQLGGWLCSLVMRYPTASVVWWSEFLATDPVVPGSISGTTRFPGK
jgi:hypothetical protein